MAVVQDIWLMQSKNAVRPVVIRTASSGGRCSRLREDISARSEKSKIQGTEAKATVDVVEMQTA